MNVYARDNEYDLIIEEAKHLDELGFNEINSGTNQAKTNYHINDNSEESRNLFETSTCYEAGDYEVGHKRCRKEKGVSEGRGCRNNGTQSDALQKNRIV